MLPYTVSQEFLQPKRSGTRLFEPVSFVCHQDKRPKIGGGNIYLVFWVYQHLKLVILGNIILMLKKQSYIC